MGEEANHILLDLTLEKIYPEHGDQWEAMKDDGEDQDEICESTSTEGSIEADSTNSIASSSSFDLAEDASSFPSSSSSSSSTMLSHANGPLYELSELITQLPIKRGLSKFYQGKSQSYTSLASVKSVEDLAKKVTYTPRNKSKIKSCKSYAAGLDGQKYSPKASISKKASRGSLLLSSLAKRGSLLGGCRPAFHV